MITRTALTSPQFLAAIKQSVVEAVRKAGAWRHTHVGARAVVRNRKSKPSLLVSFLAGGELSFHDMEGRDVTARVLQALRDWHRGGAR